MLATYREVGCCYTCFESNNFGLKLEEIANTIDIPYEVWTPAKMRANLPIMNPGHFHPAKSADDPAFGTQDGEMRYVLYFPKAGYISDPMLATQNIQSAARRHGAEFVMGERVTEVLRADGRVSGVTLDSGRTLRAPVVVNASGPHSYKVNEMAGVVEGMNIGTRALRVEVAHVPSPEGFDFEASGLICSDADIGGYWRPEVGNKILIGSEEPECDPLDWVDPDDYDTEVTEQARLQAMRAAQRFPAMGVPNRVQGIADLYDATDDWIPIYDQSDLPGFYMAVGTSGNQFKNAPVVGMMMAALVDYVESATTTIPTRCSTRCRTWTSRSTCGSAPGYGRSTGRAASPSWDRATVDDHPLDPGTRPTWCRVEAQRRAVTVHPRFSRSPRW